MSTIENYQLDEARLARRAIGAMFVIGLHFLPLARIFFNPPQYVTGGALIILALTFPLLFQSDPTAPIGCLGAGLILWTSEMRATKVR